MIRSFIYFVKIALVAWAAFWLAENPGHVSVSWNEWQLDTSVGILLVMILIFAISLLILVRLLRGFQETPGKLMDRHRDTKKRKGYEALGQGLVAVAAGDENGAKKLARKASNLLDEPALTLLLSAQTAQLSGNDVKAASYFEKMLDDPNAAFLGIRGLLSQALRDGNRHEALRLAEKARELRPETPWVIKELLGLQFDLGHMEAALKTLDQASRLQALDPEDITIKRVQVLTQLAHKAKDDGDLDKMLRLAESANRKRPGDIEASLLYASGLMSQNKAKKAEKVLEKAFALSPNAKVAALWQQSTNAPSEVLEAYSHLQKLLKLAPHHAQSLMIKSEAALNAGMWGEAREALTRLMEADTPAGPKLFQLMARLEEEEHGDRDKAHQWLTKAAESNETLPVKA